MESYVGLDVSLKQTSICVVNQAGSVVREGVVDSDPEAIAAFVRSKAPGAVRIGLETGPTATWLWTELKQLGLPVICIDARHAKAVLKMQINKSDRNDAAGIARIMQTGWFKEVRVKGLDNHSVRALLASRALLVKIKRDLENQIRGLLKNVGLVIGRAKFNVFTVRAEELIADRPELIAVVGPLLTGRSIRRSPRSFAASSSISGSGSSRTAPSLPSSRATSRRSSFSRKTTTHSAATSSTRISRSMRTRRCSLPASKRCSRRTQRSSRSA